MSEYAAAMSLRSDTASVAVFGLSLTWRMNFPVPCKQMGRIRQLCTVKEADVHVRGECIDIGEGRVAEAGDWAAVVEEFADFVAASSHHFKPFASDGSQDTCMLFHPGVDGGIAFDGAIESKQFRSQGSFHLCYECT